MNDATKAALVGAGAGVLVAGIFAMRAASNYANQGAALVATLGAQSQQVSDQLQASGATFRTELEALARAQALADAMARATTLVTQTYGLSPDVIQRLEAFRDSIA